MATTLLCLHGWGGSKASFDPLREALAGANLEILTPDLPGFGDEPDPSTPWTIDDYAMWVKEWLAKNRHGNGPLWLLGHSHGGRVSIVIAAKRILPVDELYLCAPAINRKRRYLLRRIVGVALAKVGRLFLSIPGLSSLAPAGRTLLYKLFRVHDYERSSPLMQQTMLLVTREELEPLFKDISIPVELFWGTDDTKTPISDASVLKEGIPQLSFHVFEGARHGIHKTNAREIAAVIRQRSESTR